MRILLPLIAAALLLACRGEEEANQAVAAEPGKEAPADSGLVSYSGAGRDRLCLNRQTGRAGFITYGEGNANCSVRGQLGNSGTIQPDGDSSCAIAFSATDDAVRLASGGAGCAYYCGPTASFEGKAFRRMATPEPATDLAGDPLC